MELVIVKISTPLLEKNMEKYEGWQAYASMTPMIYPWRKAK
jgi:DNA-binding protein Fis